jgi:hypothetical protein
MCYSNTTIVNMYSLYRKLVYKIIVNRGGYRITYSVAGYRIYSLSVCVYIYIYMPTRATSIIFAFVWCAEWKLKGRVHVAPAETKSIQLIWDRIYSAAACAYGRRKEYEQSTSPFSGWCVVATVSRFSWSALTANYIIQLLLYTSSMAAQTKSVLDRINNGRTLVLPTYINRNWVTVTPYGWPAPPTASLYYLLLERSRHIPSCLVPPSLNLYIGQNK